MSIGDCESCDRRNVPVSHLTDTYCGDVTACHLCQGDTDPDPYGEMDDLALVTCPTCNGSSVSLRAVWVYDHGCGFPREDVEEDPCPECEGNGQLLVECQPITLSDLEQINMEIAP